MVMLNGIAHGHAHTHAQSYTHAYCTFPSPGFKVTNTVQEVYLSNDNTYIPTMMMILM